MKKEDNILITNPKDLENINAKIKNGDIVNCVGNNALGVVIHFESSHPQDSKPVKEDFSYQGLGRKYNIEELACAYATDSLGFDRDSEEYEASLQLIDTISTKAEKPIKWLLQYLQSESSPKEEKQESCITSEENNWISVKDKMPENDSLVMTLKFGGPPIDCVVLASYYDNERMQGFYTSSESLDVKYWATMPVFPSSLKTD